MSLGLGDYDKNNIHNLSTPNRNYGNGYEVKDGFPFPSEYRDLNNSDDVFISDDKVVEDLVTSSVDRLTEDERDAALKAYYRQQLKSESVELKLKERKVKLLDKARFHEWVKYLLLFVSTLLLISLIAIVATVIYTSLNSGTMTEIGIVAAIVAFFSEIIRVLISN